MSEQVDLDPESATYRLIARIVTATAETMGRPSGWNGRIVIESGTRDSGRAWPDGTLELQRDATLAPITAAQAGDGLDETELALLVNAFTTTVHEGAHLVERDGDERAGHPDDSPGVIALDEGLIERWTHDHLDDVLHRAGVDELVPQVIGERLHDAYPAYTKGTGALVDGVAAMTGRRPDEIEAGLMSTERTQRWNKLVDVVVAGGLGGTATEAERTRLADVARMRFGECVPIDRSTQFDAVAMQEHGALVGRQTVARIIEEVAAIHQDRANDRAAEVTAIDRDPNRYDDFVSGRRTVIPGFARSAPSAEDMVSAPDAPQHPDSSDPGAGNPASEQGVVGAERRAPGAHAARRPDKAAPDGQGARPSVAARLEAMMRRSHRGGIHRG